MPISDLKKDKLRKLELERGGVAFATEKSSPTPTPTVVISLGGLGAQTLNTLKGKFNRDIIDCDHIWFRMIDTDVDTFEKLCKTNMDGTASASPNANMENGETIPLYDQSLAKVLTPAYIPSYIDQWLNPALKGRLIKSNGAQQIRQIGRVMVVHDTVYNKVRSKLVVLNEAATAANGGVVDVILIAGVSGGTGSGSVIDISYMIHDYMMGIGYVNYKLAGYIFTPDAQFTIPAIASSSIIQANLKTNGYSALKEIDYFMNLEETNSSYKLQLMNNRVVESKRNIFDSCTLVSGYNEVGGLRSTSDIISCLTDHLMDMLTDIQITNDGGQPEQMADSIMSNDFAFVGQWFNQHPERKLYHRYATYKYQILGYNSIRIPRDEIFAYCVDKIYEGVLEEFKNFHNVNKQMLRKVFDAAHIGSPDDLTIYTEDFWKVNRNISLDGYSKRMVKNNPMIAYDDACEVADSEADRITSAVMGRLEEDIYDNLKKQIDLVFEKYGPYVAMRAIQHEWNCKTDGDPNEPFHGVFEQLIVASEYMVQTANQCRQAVDKETIQDKAYSATRMGILIGGATEADMAAYVSECCRQAVEQRIDPVFFDALSKVLINVAARINDYNSELFSVYTAILDEVQYILSKDSDYFSKGSKAVVGKVELYSVDLIKSGSEEAKRLQKYLDDFISQVSVHALAQNFIKSMRVNKEKWLAQQNENNFDVVSEVQDLMDDCLRSNNMIPEIIEKFVVVAYHPKDLTPDELDAIWLDDTPNGKKNEALKAAAQYIMKTLEAGARAMAHSANVVSLSAYGQHLFVTALQDTPKIREILDEIVFHEYQTHIAVSTSRNKFIYTRQYYCLPMYILMGMKDYNEQYVNNPSAGRHMDERGQDWTRFQNPYTIDSVGLDLESSGRHPDDINTYSDKVILDEVKKHTKYGVDIGYVKVERKPAASAELTLYDITGYPADMKQFNEELYEEAFNAAADEESIDLIAFMEQHGFKLKQVMVHAGVTDVDLGLMDFGQATAADMANKYNNIPVQVEDVYKWLRKSIMFMDILKKDYDLFKKLEQILKKAADDADSILKYRSDVRIFALALKTGLVRRINSDQEQWEYMDDNNKPIQVDLRLEPRFDRKFFLYHVFVEFQKLSKDSLKKIDDQATQNFRQGNVADSKEFDFIKDHIREMLDNACLGNKYNQSAINNEAREETEVTKYVVTDEKENIKNPFNVLKRFYTRLNASL